MGFRPQAFSVGFLHALNDRNLGDDWLAGRLTKPRASRPSRRNWQTGATNCSNKGSSVFLNLFDRGQALLLSSLRVRVRKAVALNARNSRAKSLMRGRKRGKSANTDRHRTGRNHDSSMSANSPRPCLAHANRRGNNQSTSVAMNRLWLATTGLWERTWMLRRQTMSPNLRWPQPAHGPALAAILIRQ